MAVSLSLLVQLPKHPSLDLSTPFTSAAANQPLITVLFVAAIFILSIAWAAWYLVKISRLQKSLQGFLDSWKELGPEDFFTRLEDIDQQLQDNRHLRHPWSEFKETFIYPEPDDDDQVVSNTINAAAFFDEDAIFSPEMDLAFLRAVPNILTGLGILGTFLGLVLALYGAMGLLDDPKKINALFNGAYLAFLTSLSGLFCSILFSVILNRRVHSVSQTLQDLVNFLDSRARRLTTESLSRTLVSHARRQTKSLELFTTDVAVAIGDQINDNLNTALLPALDAIKQALDKNLETQREDIVGSLQKVVENLQESLQEATGEQLRGFAASLATVQATLDATTENLKNRVDEAGEALGEKLDASASSFGEKLSVIVESLDRSGTQFASHIEDASQALQAVAVVLDEKRRALEAGATTLSASLKGLTALTELLDGSTKNLADSSNTLTKSLAQTAALVEKLLDATGAAKDVALEMEEFFAAGKKMMETLHDGWESYTKRFEKLDESLAGTFGAISEGLEGYRAQVATFHNQLDANVKEISGMLTAAIEELSEVCDAISGSNEP